MKTGVYSTLSMLISNIAIILCCLPFFLLLSKKMRRVAAYKVAAIYWLLNAVINFVNLDIFPVFRNSGLQDRLILYYNLLDTPLVLLIFACASSGIQKKTIILSMLIFLAGECILVGCKGYGALSSATIIGVGLLLIFTFSITGLVQYMRKIEHSPFENSMAFIYAALLFAYGSFLIIYIFIQFRGGGEATSRDSFLLYYISLLLSAAITTMGLWSYGFRPQPQSSR